MATSSSCVTKVSLTGEDIFDYYSDPYSEKYKSLANLMLNEAKNSFKSNCWIWHVYPNTKFNSTRNLKDQSLQIDTPDKFETLLRMPTFIDVFRVINFKEDGTERPSSYFRSDSARVIDWRTKYDLDLKSFGVIGESDEQNQILRFESQCKLEEVTTKKIHQPVALTLDKALEVYTTRHFLSKKSYDQCELALGHGDQKRVFLIKSNSEATDDDVKAGLRYRYPVYFGTPQNNHFHEDKLRVFFGYTSAEVSSRDLEKARFGICGPLRTQQKIRGVEPWAIHVWAPNFESDTTIDYQTYAHLPPDSKLQWYSRRCLELYSTIACAAMQLTKSKKKRVCVRIPLIGQGAFMDQITDKHERINLRQQHVDALLTVAEAASDKVTFIVLDRNLHFILAGDDPRWRQIETLEGPVAGWSYKVHSRAKVEVYHDANANLFDVPKIEGVALLVNAWDNRSFIGNGGSKDPTIDGFFVSGNGPGNRLYNSSYTHNPFFATQLYNPSLWHHAYQEFEFLKTPRYKVTRLLGRSKGADPGKPAIVLIGHYFDIRKNELQPYVQKLKKYLIQTERFDPHYMKQPMTVIVCDSHYKDETISSNIRTRKLLGAQTTMQKILSNFGDVSRVDAIVSFSDAFQFDFDDGAQSMKANAVAFLKDQKSDLISRGKTDSFKVDKFDFPLFDPTTNSQAVFIDAAV